MDTRNSFKFSSVWFHWIASKWSCQPWTGQIKSCSWDWFWTYQDRHLQYWTQTKIEGAWETSAETSRETQIAPPPVLATKVKDKNISLYYGSPEHWNFLKKWPARSHAAFNIFPHSYDWSYHAHAPSHLSAWHSRVYLDHDQGNECPCRNEGFGTHQA